MRIGLYLKSLDEEYQISVFRGAMQEAQALGVELFCIQQHVMDFTEEEENFIDSKHLSLDGCLLLTSVFSNPYHITNIAQTNHTIPHISLGRTLDSLPSVVINSETSLSSLVIHLVEDHGYRNFLYLGGNPQHPDNIDRKQIFCKQMEQVKKQYDKITFAIMHAEWSESIGYSMVHQCIKDNPESPYDVIVAANDNMAIGAIKAIKASQNKAWQHTAITGFDDIPQARHTKPPLTTVSQPLIELGATGVRVLVDTIKGYPIRNRYTVESLLVVRSSCISIEAHSTLCKQSSLSKSLPLPYTEIDQFMWQDLYLRQVSDLGQQITTLHNLSDIFEQVAKFLKNLHVVSFDCILFDSLLHAKQGDWVFQFSQESFRISEIGEHVVNLQEFFKSHFKTQHTHALYPLVSGNQKIGILVYQADYFLYPHIYSASLFLANTLQRLQLEEREQLRLQILELEVAKRTADLQRAHKTLQAEAEERLKLEAQVLKISDMERRRFSLDLHDDICQRLAGISLFMQGLHNVPTMESLKEMVDDTLVRTRNYAHQSFPMDLEELGLSEALQSLSEMLEHQSQVACNYTWQEPNSTNLTVDFTVEQKINLYRIAQEAVQNIIKHANASEVDIQMVITTQTVEQRKQAILTIQDNGTGYDFATSAPCYADNTKGIQKRPHGLGLQSMKYRAHQLGGSFEHTSVPGKGTLVRVSVPM